MPPKVRARARPVALRLSWHGSPWRLGLDSTSPEKTPVDSAQKRDRDRKQRQKRQEKAVRKKERAEQKVQRRNDPDAPAWPAWPDEGPSVDSPPGGEPAQGS